MGDFGIAIQQEFKMDKVLLGVDFHHGWSDERHDPVAMNQAMASDKAG